MIRAIAPIGFALFCLMIGNAALNSVSGLLAAEQVEICHRSGATDCPELPR